MFKHKSIYRTHCFIQDWINDVETSLISSFESVDQPPLTCRSGWHFRVGTDIRLHALVIWLTLEEVGCVRWWTSTVVRCDWWLDTFVVWCDVGVWCPVGLPAWRVGWLVRPWCVGRETWRFLLEMSAKLDLNKWYSKELIITVCYSDLCNRHTAIIQLTCKSLTVNNSLLAHVDNSPVNNF